MFSTSNGATDWVDARTGIVTTAVPFWIICKEQSPLPVTYC